MTVIDINVATGEIIEREMSKEEFDQLKADQAATTLRQKEKDALASRKAELLEKLGITEDEARLLLA